MRAAIFDFSVPALLFFKSMHNENERALVTIPYREVDGTTRAHSCRCLFIWYEYEYERKQSEWKSVCRIWKSAIDFEFQSLWSRPNILFIQTQRRWLKTKRWDKLDKKKSATSEEVHLKSVRAINQPQSYMEWSKHLASCGRDDITSNSRDYGEPHRRTHHRALVAPTWLSSWLSVRASFWFLFDTFCVPSSSLHMRLKKYEDYFWVQCDVAMRASLNWSLSAIETVNSVCFVRWIYSVDCHWSLRWNAMNYNASNAKQGSRRRVYLWRKYQTEIIIERTKKKKCEKGKFMWNKNTTEAIKCAHRTLEWPTARRELFPHCPFDRWWINTNFICHLPFGNACARAVASFNEWENGRTCEGVRIHTDGCVRHGE